MLIITSSNVFDRIYTNIQSSDENEYALKNFISSISAGDAIQLRPSVLKIMSNFQWLLCVTLLMHEPTDSTFSLSQEVDFVQLDY